MQGNNHSDASNTHGGGKQGGKRPMVCFTCAGEQAMSVHISLHPRANMHMVENNNNTRYNNRNNSVQDLTDDMSYHFFFMLNRWSFFSFLFEDRRALVTINSNCCRHITGFIIYCIPSPEISWWMVHLMGQPCVGIMSGTMHFGDIFFKDTIFVPDIEVTIISLGQLDGEGCRTEMSNER